MTAAEEFNDGYKKVASPYGFSMYGVEATEALEKASRAAQEIIRAHGFERIMPALVDYPETFAAATHGEMFSLKDNSGERLALRNDITAQVIKGYVRQIESRPGENLRKFFYAAPVYKDVRKNYPLPREIFQIGCEVIGDNAGEHLKSLVLVAQQILKQVLKIHSATAVSDVRLHAIFCEFFGGEFIEAEDRRDTPRLTELFRQKFGLDIQHAQKLALALLYPTHDKLEAGLVKSLPEAMRTALGSAKSAVASVLEDLKKSGVDAYWQPLCRPRSSYYSGLFFESYVPGFTEPLVRGGVYNDLVKRYANIEAGACGFALDLLAF